MSLVLCCKDGKIKWLRMNSCSLTLEIMRYSQCYDQEGRAPIKHLSICGWWVDVVGTGAPSFLYLSPMNTICRGGDVWPNGPWLGSLRVLSTR